MANLKKNSDIMVDQLRTIDNRRLRERIGKIPEEKINELKENILAILDLFEQKIDFRAIYNPDE